MSDIIANAVLIFARAVDVITPCIIPAQPNILCAAMGDEFVLAVDGNRPLMRVPIVEHRSFQDSIAALDIMSYCTIPIQERNQLGRPTWSLFKATKK